MVQVGKFDIFATFNFVKAKVSGSSDSQAKEYGYMIAVMGARGKGGSFKPKSTNTVKKTSAPKAKKQLAFSAADYDRQIVSKMGEFYNKKFLPAIERLVKAGVSYERIKAGVDFPKGRGTKMDGNDFVKRAAKVA